MVVVGKFKEQKRAWYLELSDVQFVGCYLKKGKTWCGDQNTVVAFAKSRFPEGVQMNIVVFVSEMVRPSMVIYNCTTLAIVLCCHDGILFWSCSLVSYFFADHIEFFDNLNLLFQAKCGNDSIYYAAVMSHIRRTTFYFSIF